MALCELGSNRDVMIMEAEMATKSPCPTAGLEVIVVDMEQPRASDANAGHRISCRKLHFVLVSPDSNWWVVLDYYNGLAAHADEPADPIACNAVPRSLPIGFLPVSPEGSYIH